MNYMFVFKALHIYKNKLLMVLRTFYEMENVFYTDQGGGGTKIPDVMMTKLYF